MVQVNFFSTDSLLDDVTTNFNVMILVLSIWAERDFLLAVELVMYSWHSPKHMGQGPKKKQKEFFHDVSNVRTGWSTGHYPLLLELSAARALD